MGGRKRLLFLLHPLRHMGDAPTGRIRTSSRIWSSRYDALSSSTCGACSNLHGRSPPVVTSSGPYAVTYSPQPQLDQLSRTWVLLRCSCACFYVLDRAAS